MLLVAAAIVEAAWIRGNRTVFSIEDVLLEVVDPSRHIRIAKLAVVTQLVRDFLLIKLRCRMEQEERRCINITVCRGFVRTIAKDVGDCTIAEVYVIIST